MRMFCSYHSGMCLTISVVTLIGIWIGELFPGRGSLKNLYTYFEPFSGLAIVMAEDPTDIVSAAHPGKHIVVLANSGLIASRDSASWDALCPAFDALPAQTFT